VQVILFHLGTKVGTDRAFVSLILYVIHDVVSDRLVTEHTETSVLWESHLICLLDHFFLLYLSVSTFASEEE
jgi:hypothetical protein